MKYIDAEKLRAEIERRRLSNRYIDTEGYEAELFEIIDTLSEEHDDPWKVARLAARVLNKMELGVLFYGNLFPYLRKRGKLDGLCEFRFHGRRPEWRYDTEGIAALVKAGKLDYKPR